MTNLADREWRLIRDDPRDGPTQMALEEIATRTAVEDGVRTVRVYSWEPSTLSLGYRQEKGTVDWKYCEREGIDVTRRQTGGGGIYHDAYGDISYTIVAPADEVPGDLMDCYELFCEPILEAFDRIGVDAAFANEEQPSIHQPSCYLRDINPAHDIVVPSTTTGTTSGGLAKKISGNAQYRQRDAVIQHGSLSYDLEPEHHLGVFDDPGITPEEFADRVTSIHEQAGIDREEAVETVADALGDWCDAAESTWRKDELENARAFAAKKYADRAWIRDRTTPQSSELPHRESAAER